MNRTADSWLSPTEPPCSSDLSPHSSVAWPHRSAGWLALLPGAGTHAIPPPVPPFSPAVTHHPLRDTPCPPRFTSSRDSPQVLPPASLLQPLMTRSAARKRPPVLGILTAPCVPGEGEYMTQWGGV
ncbi:hypothetical protein HJG60_009591 [Phyllostomus discolor]|uniref:Uncharacterized protein n=1 Tax=Phyllostomus discolor TaxID=89673 RepID=A0A833Y883_9CHIR|nr:hypothetical protein HJG60_009591 [Phyllostomus discolor]